MDYRIHDGMESKNIDFELITAGKVHFINYIKKNKHINNGLREIAEYWVYDGSIYQCIKLFICCKEKKKEIVRVLYYVKNLIRRNKKSGIKYIVLRIKLDLLRLLLRLL